MNLHAYLFTVQIGRELVQAVIMLLLRRLKTAAAVGEWVMVLWRRFTVATAGVGISHLKLVVVIIMWYHGWVWLD